MNAPKVHVTNREALVALMRSGDPYIAESEIARDRIMTRFYKPDAEYAVAEMVLEGDGIGIGTNLVTLAMAGDEGAQQELSSGRHGIGADAH